MVTIDCAAIFAWCAHISLFPRVSDTSGQMEIDLIKTGQLSQADLQGQDAFLVNGGGLGVYVWLGEHQEDQEGQE